jgi:hypothetical protein
MPVTVVLHTGAVHTPCICVRCSSPFVAEGCTEEAPDTVLLGRLHWQETPTCVCERPCDVYVGAMPWDELLGVLDHCR